MMRPLMILAAVLVAAPVYEPMLVIFMLPMMGSEVLPSPTW